MFQYSSLNHAIGKTAEWNNEIQPSGNETVSLCWSKLAPKNNEPKSNSRRKEKQLRRDRKSCENTDKIRNKENYDEELGKGKTEHQFWSMQIRPLIISIAIK